MEAIVENTRNYLMSITDREFELFSTLIHHRFGIHLTAQKRGLLVARLQQMVRKAGFDTFRKYYDHLVKGNDQTQLQELVDRISTNFTYFNREKEHFDFFIRRALPNTVRSLKDEGENDLRVWCCASSTGEEPYTLLMLMREFFGGDYFRWSGGILATDISEKVLKTARQGIYPDDKAQALPHALRDKYMTRLADGCWQMKESLRQEATFRRFNLMNSDYPFRRPFHIIFCRNVMIYFNAEDRHNVIRKLHQVLAPGGFLFIGHSESLGANNKLFATIQPSVYQRL
ncbi:MAG: protein-glutamate O-methyltransferase CheR [Deltaproteobacteria bacterium]|nr:protein-glutamate O-methyltransferase CheR [Deltaproteobacteria bacterium]